MSKQLECRVVITYRKDGRINLGMHDPKSGRYAPLGVHGPGRGVIDKAVAGLVQSIEAAGHRVSFSEKRE